MKKVQAFVLAIIATSVISCRKLPGYVIGADGQKTDVTIKVPFKLLGKPDFERLQKKVRYFDSNKTRHVLRPTEAQEISFTHKQQTYRMLSRPFDNLVLKMLNKKVQLFLHLLKDGRLKLFMYYETRNSGSSMNHHHMTSFGMVRAAGMYPYSGSTYHFEKYLLQKGDEPLFRTNFLTFKKDMSEYLKDCESVVNKIIQKELRNRDMEELVDEYNLKCN